jgi:hypothetical protein
MLLREPCLTFGTDLDLNEEPNTGLDFRRDRVDSSCAGGDNKPAEFCDMVKRPAKTVLYDFLVLLHVPETRASQADSKVNIRGILLSVNQNQHWKMAFSEFNHFDACT